MSSHANHVDFRPPGPTMLSHYGSLVLASFAVVGAIGWTSAVGVQPLAALVVLATIISLWVAFAEHGSLPRSIVGVAAVLAIPIIGLSIRDETLPSWLTRGPWNTLGQAVSLAGLLILNRQPAEIATSLLDEPSHDFPKASWLSRQTTGSIICYGIAAATLSFLVVIPVGEALLEQIREPEMVARVSDMTIAESILLRAVQVFAAVWAFLIGACVGSFANVLVYRQPRGESVLTRPSACPKCETRIEARDNIPIIGWLRLGGKCRNCQTSISARYPIVEAVAGTIFVLLVFVELTSGGANLPVRRINSNAGFVWTIFYPRWDLIAITLYHFHLFIMLLTWCLMRLDRVQLPARSVIPALLIAIAGPLMWTKLWLVPPGFAGTAHYTQPIDVVAIAIAAAVAMSIALAALGALLRIDTFRNLAPPLALTAATLGWQALLVIATAACLIRLILKALRVQITSPGWSFFAVAMLHHFCWRAIDSITR